MWLCCTSSPLSPQAASPTCLLALVCAPSALTAWLHNLSSTYPVMHTYTLSLLYRDVRTQASH